MGTVSRRAAATCVIGLALLAVAPAHADDTRIKVTVVAILASSKHDKVDDRLKELAPALKKKDASWTGFEVERTSTASLKVGDKKSFKLVDDTEVTVEIKSRDESGVVSLQLKPPTLGDVDYSCCCEKFFPIVTRYDTKSDKRLIIA